MARYTNLKCGNCSYSFTGGYSPGYQSALGVSKIKCPKCLTINKTSAKPYSQFNIIDLFAFWFGRIIRILLLGIMYGGLLGYGIGSLFNTPLDSYIFGGVLITIFIGNIVFNYFSIKFEISETEKEEANFETPEMERDRHKWAASKSLSSVENLTKKLADTFPKYDPSKSYDLWENETNYFELSDMKDDYLKDFEILTWPTTKSCIDENNKVFFEHIALYIRKADINRFVNDKLNFNGPVYIQEDLVFDENGKLLLWGYFEHPKTKILLQQAKDNLSLVGKSKKPDTAYFVIHKQR
jgi:hypothetical protein